MKIFAYQVMEKEKVLFEQLAKEFQLTIETTEEKLSIETVDLAIGFDGITFLECDLHHGILSRLADENIKYLATRTVGYDYIDVPYVKSLGMRVCNANYPPHSVADFTVMLMLMTLRNVTSASKRGLVNDFSLAGLRGKVIHEQTVGIIGAGKIGSQVAANLQGFGCDILVYDIKENPEVAKMATYVDLDTLLSSSDILSLHTPLDESTYHLLNDERIGKMKDGALFINTSRGEVVDTEALVRALESGKIGGVALDVLEGEQGIFFHDRRLDKVNHKNLAYLRQFPNVLTTPHMAFYTDNAIRHMVKNSVMGLVAFYQEKDWVNEL